MKTQRREVRIRCIQCHRPFLIWCWYLDNKFEKDIIAVNGQWKRGSQYHPIISHHLLRPASYHWVFGHLLSPAAAGRLIAAAASMKTPSMS